MKKLDKAADLYKKVYDNNIKLCADILFFALNTYKAENFIELRNSRIP